MMDDSPRPPEQGIERRVTDDHLIRPADILDPFRPSAHEHGALPSPCTGVGGGLEEAAAVLHG